MRVQLLLPLVALVIAACDSSESPPGVASDPGQAGTSGGAGSEQTELPNAGSAGAGSSEPTAGKGGASSGGSSSAAGGAGGPAGAGGASGAQGSGSTAGSSGSGGGASGSAGEGAGGASGGGAGQAGGAGEGSAGQAGGGQAGAEQGGAAGGGQAGAEQGGAAGSGQAGAGQCPAAGGEVGYEEGQSLGAIVVRDCDTGAEASIDELCGAAATWIFVAHTHCPTCKATAKFTDSVASAVADKQVAVAHIVYNDNGTSCAEWKSAFGLENLPNLKVYEDPTGKAWEQLKSSNYTAPSVFLNQQRVITHKAHGLSEASVLKQIDAALSP